MYEFIKVFGLIIAGIGALIAALSIALSGGTTTVLGMFGGIYGVLIGAGIALPGAMLFCLGAIVELLIAI